MRQGYYTDVSLLVPEGDELVQAFRGLGHVIQGPENDVLGRYIAAQSKVKADYMVRITGDCPMIPDYLIQKIIKIGILNNHDYVSNVGDDEETTRTTIDGYDCEFMSARMLAYLGEMATEPKDREHVTSLARREKPEWASYGHVMGYADFSGIKLSVDTMEDYERVKTMMELLAEKEKLSVAKYGKVYHF